MKLVRDSGLHSSVLCADVLTSEHPYPPSCSCSVRLFSAHIQYFTFQDSQGHILGRLCCIWGLSLISIFLFALQCILSHGFITFEASGCHPIRVMSECTGRIDHPFEGGC